MGKPMYDSKWDSLPVYIVLLLVHAFFLVAWLAGWTNYGLNARAASGLMHVTGVALFVVSWLIMYKGKQENTIVDFDYPVWIAIFILAYCLFPLFLCGFTFNIAS